MKPHKNTKESQKDKNAFCELKKGIFNNKKIAFVEFCVLLCLPAVDRVQFL